MTAIAMPTCFPGPWTPPSPSCGRPPFGCWPPPYSTEVGNLPDSAVGQNGWLFPQTTRGYGLDLNGNGRYDRGTDGVLAFDLNRDGRIDDREVQESNERLKAFGGNYDLNGDGRVNFCERIRGERLRSEMQQMDRNRDGVLDAGEIDANGGRVCIDRDRDGHFGAWEQHSPYRFPTPGFGTGSLGYVDPHCSYSEVNQNPWGGWRPWGWNAGWGPRC